ncbi:MAG: hypothetical protein GF332_04160 [Candidatus Moranbacteria bacterium]|nr:hypothetical protein [Candidatus Moranbacteria bacterium]
MNPNFYKNQLIKLDKLLNKFSKIAITTHKAPDGDALGSSLALKQYLESAGVTTRLYLQEHIDKNLKFLPGVEEYFFQDRDYFDFQALIILDCNNFPRTGLSKSFLTQAQSNLIFIDHHDLSGKQAPENLFSIIDSNKAATSEIINDFFNFNQIQITSSMAICLLTGIYTDTGGFLHANTTSKIMQNAGDLMQKGATLSLIAKKTISNRQAHSLKIWGRALARARINQNKMAYTYVTEKDFKDCQASVDDLSGVGNVLGSSKESDYSLMLTQTKPDKIKGSLRTEAEKSFNVTKVARQFKGGGHPLASGFEIKGRISQQDGRVR